MALAPDFGSLSNSLVELSLQQDRSAFRAELSCFFWAFTYIRCDVGPLGLDKRGWPPTSYHSPHLCLQT